ncbi:MAG: hypothetical protein OEZ01_15550 [Candidatus Heimdallarchaeota archaeon]|nr:hypothetical protein [Candidatus Heimdallarchaeota archaeon]MDH5647424.1 hypothetical protein [Candidatus Heimdallarchaeota archaeon]
MVTDDYTLESSFSKLIVAISNLAIVIPLIIILEVILFMFGITSIITGIDYIVSLLKTGLWLGFLVYLTKIVDERIDKNYEQNKA